MNTAAIAHTALVTVLLAAAPALAGDGGDRKSGALDGGDRAFLQKAASGNLAEVHLGTLAAAKGSTPTVRQFGRWMISTHSLASRELASLAETLHDTTPPLKQRSDTADTMGKLQNLTGAAFDTAYLDAMATDHEADIKALSAEAEKGQAPLVKSYAANLLPTVREHLAEVRLLQAEARGGDRHGAETDANMKAAAGGMGGTPQGNDDQAKAIQKQQSGR